MAKTTTTIDIRTSNASGWFSAALNEMGITHVRASRGFPTSRAFSKDNAKPYQLMEARYVSDGVAEIFVNPNHTSASEALHTLAQAALNLRIGATVKPARLAQAFAEAGLDGSDSPKAKQMKAKLAKLEAKLPAYTVAGDEDVALHGRVFKAPKQTNKSAALNCQHCGLTNVMMSRGKIRDYGVPQHCGEDMVEN